MSHALRCNLHGLAVAACVLWAAACNNGNLTSTSLSGSVVTLVDSGPALESALAFALPDTVVELPVTSNTLGHAADREITATIRRHFLDMGWRDAVTAGVSPDVVIITAAMTRIQTGVIYSDWYSGWGYLPYWGAPVNSSWGWGAPVGAIPYEFPAGTLIVVMLDLRAQHADTRTITLLWAAAVDGVIRSQATTAERALVGLDQAFTQSPYLVRPPT